MNTFQLDATFVLMLVCSDSNLLSSEHENLWMKASLVMPPIHGMTFTLFRQKQSSEKRTAAILGPSLQLKVNAEDIRYNLSTQEVFILFRMGFASETEMKLALNDLVNGFGFATTLE